MSKLEAIKIGGCYTATMGCMSVEVLEFQTITLKDDSYQNELETVIYVDEDSNLQSMQIDTFANSFN